MVGTTLKGKYRLDEELGRGGMGAVYRAFHLLVHKEFAVKVLNAELTAHAKVAQRFFLEAQAAGRIGHPGILEVYDVGEDDDGRPFMVMELLVGEPLNALVARGPLGIDEACWIASRVLDVLVAAHEAGVVHRDVKPQNVFLVSDGDKRRIKLLDFGIAKFITHEGGSLTHSGEIIGSPLYMAPEQAKGESDVDARADVWSVGAMLFEMLTGKPAHSATSAVAVLAKILTEQVVPPSSARTGKEPIPPALDAVVVKALTIDRGARIASARAMRDALEAVRSALGTANTVPSFAALPARTVVRVGDEREDQVGVSTATVASGPARSGAGEPPMEAAVTNADANKARSRPIALVAALATIVGAVLLVFLGPWSGGKPASPPEPATLAPASAPPTPPAPPPLVSASASASEAPLASAPPSAARDAAPPSLPSRPACAANEISSNGHCCPRGLAWQAGACARPLATSF